MSNDHNEDCNCLSENHRFTIAIFELNKGGKEFQFWYENIFKQENSLSDHFDFSLTEDDGEEVLEVMQFNPYFSVDALVTMFQGYQEENRKTLEQPPKMVN